MMKSRKAIIFGIKGLKLLKSEKLLFQRVKPWGVILFSRNIKDLDQLKLLVKNIKNIFKDNKYPILIDQEGGTVSRLNKIFDFSYFSQDYFGKLYKKDKVSFIQHYKVYVNTVSDLLNYVGININTVPVMDVKRKNTHNIIGKRSFSNNFNNIRELGKICIKLFKKNNVGTVIKHIPGHGLSKFDSHFKTPIINEKKSILKKIDFAPFIKSKAFFAMTAHIIYTDYDKVNTATHSKIIIKKVIRDYIKFKGLLISDDISMKSLKFNLEKNATTALNSGCNLVLHCNGKMKEMRRLAKVIPKLDNFTQKKTSDFYKFLM